MREILVVNPTKRRTKKTKKAAKAKKTTRSKPKRRTQEMAKKKRRTRKAPAKRRTTNPTRRRRRTTVRRASRAISRSFMGLNFRKALGDMPYVQAGMFAAKWCAKRFGENASETDPDSWNWASYLKGAVGGVAAGMVMNSFRRGSGQKVLEGALNLMAYKAIQNELIAGNEWATGQFGEDEEDYVPTEYLLTGTDESPMAYDEYGNQYPADDLHRLPEVSGSALEPVGPLGAYSNALEPVGPLGEEDPWAETFLQ